MVDLSALHQIALTLHRQGQFAQAEQQYLQILELNGEDWDTWNNLGALYYGIGHYEAAFNAVQSALRSDRPKAMYYCTLGLVLEQLGRVRDAITAYHRGIELDPHQLELYTNLTALLCDQKEWMEAELICRQAIAIDKNHLDSYSNLGLVLMSQDKQEAAIEVYEQALQIQPSDPRFLIPLGTALIPINEPRALLNFGDAYYFQHRYDEAVYYYQTLIDAPLSDWSSSSIAQLYARLGDCCRRLQQPEAAISIYQQGLERCSGSSGLYLELIWTLRANGDPQQAIAIAQTASVQFPHDVFLKREYHLLLPILYQTTHEIEDYRHRFSDGLSSIIDSTPLHTPADRQNALLGVSVATNFYLQYQGYNDRDLQRQYGEWVHGIMAANYPQWATPLTMPPLNGRIRIGYISNFFCDHTISKLFMGWCKYANHDLFHIHTYHLGQRVDEWTQELSQFSDVLYHLPLQTDLDLYLRQVAQQIITDQLHVLVYPDLGMSPITTLLAALRLAPVQAMSWGHPTTSGLPTMDFMLSSELMEPTNSAIHYTETLINLPGLGICPIRPTIPPCTTTRADFQIRPDGFVYLSCQSLYKYLPHYDWVFAHIAQQVPHAQFVFIANENIALSQQFAQRLQNSFTDLGLNIEDYCVILPRLSQEAYWDVNQLADVYLDTLDWSGGISTLEAIACNLPIVTCPGQLMRGRHGYGILSFLNLGATIASDVHEYVAIAVRLGTDPQWYQSIKTDQMKQTENLYTDRTGINALEEFYRRVVSVC